MTLREAWGTCLPQSHPKAVPAAVQNQIIEISEVPLLAKYGKPLPPPSVNFHLEREVLGSGLMVTCKPLSGPWWYVVLTGRGTRTDSLPVSELQPPYLQNGSGRMRGDHREQAGCGRH